MTEFTVTEEHITLLQRLCLDTRDEKPQISSKRPFGNSDYYTDVLKLTDNYQEPHIEDPLDDGDYILTENGKAKAETLLNETQTALEILLTNLTIQPTTYTKQNRNWQEQT